MRLLLLAAVALVALAGVFVVLPGGAVEARAQTLPEGPFLAAGADVPVEAAGKAESGAAAPSALLTAPLRATMSGVAVAQGLSAEDEGDATAPLAACLLSLFWLAHSTGKLSRASCGLPKPSSALPSPLERPG